MVDVVARDHAATVKLTATITRLTMQLATINEKLIFVLQTKLASRGRSRVRNKAARGAGASHRAGDGAVGGYGAGSGAGARTISGAGTPAPAETAEGVELDPAIQY